MHILHQLDLSPKSPVFPKRIKSSDNFCLFAVILTCITLSSFTFILYPFPFNSQCQISLDDGITSGSRLTRFIYLFEERIFKETLIEHVCWVDARIAGDLKHSGPCLCLRWPGSKWLNDWTNMTKPGDWEVEKRAYLFQRSSHQLFKAGLGAEQAEEC